MRYRFSLGRGEAAMVLGGAALVGVLLFCSGLMTGLAVARNRSTPPADAVMAAAPEPEEIDAEDASAAEDGETADSAGQEQTDGVGGPGTENAAPVVAAADGWSLPEGYAAPQGSATRWASIPSLDGAGEGTSADVFSERAVPAALRSRPAIREPVPEPTYTPRPGGSRFGAYDGGGAPYALEVGRFRGEEAALKMMNELHARGHEVYLYTVVEGGAPMFSVRMNRYIDRQTAMRAAERLETRERLAALVVPTEQR